MSSLVVQSGLCAIYLSMIFVLSFRIISTAVGFKNRYLSWKHWQKWCLNVITSIRSNNIKFGEMEDDFDDQGESPAVEVLKYRDQGGDFASQYS